MDTKTSREGAGRGATAWALGLSSLTIGLVAAGLFFFVSSREVPTVVDWGFRGYPVVLILPFAAVGVVLASRRPENPIGWIFCFVGLISAVQMVIEEYAIYASVRPDLMEGAQTVEWIGHWIWIPGPASIAMSLLLFPTGKLPSLRWRPVAWLIGAAAGMAIAGFVLGSPESMGMTGVNPLESEALTPLGDLVTWVGLALLMVSLILAVASIVVRMRGSRIDERQQFKWLIFGAALVPLGNVVATLPVPALIQNLGVCALGGLPIAVGIAVLKYRLYDIDVVINRALVYTALTIVLAATYFAVVVILQQLIGRIAEESDLAIAGSTLAVAALFRPLRTRIQTFIDRRFYRRKYDAAATLGALSSRLRDEVDLESLTKDLTAMIGATVQPGHVSIWLRDKAATDSPAFTSHAAD